MSSPLENIKSLIPYLPKGDIKFANKFLEQRNYEALKDLTWSAFQRLIKAYKKEVLPEKYRDIDLDRVRDLAVAVEDYYYLLYPEELEEMIDKHESREEEKEKLI